MQGKQDELHCDSWIRVTLQLMVIIMVTKFTFNLSLGLLG